MKKMLKIILIIILFKGSLIAQKSDVPDYYNLINQAELSICDSDLAKALVLYDSAFQSIENKIPYYKDVYNALISAIEKNDDTSILKYWDALCKQGLDSAFINGSQKINALRDKTYWRKLENDMNLYHKEKDARYLFLCEVINDDQKIRKEYDARRIGNKYVVFRDTIMFVDSLNYIRLITDFNTNGFPDDNVAINFNPFNHPVYYYVLEHNAMWNRIWMDAAILKNIDSLRFHPLLYTKLMDYHNDQFVKDAERMYGTNYHAIIDGRLFVFSGQLEPGLKEQINLNRSRVHLEDIDSYSKKIAFQFFHRDYCLIYPFLFSRMVVDQSVAEILFKKWKDVEVKSNR